MGLFDSLKKATGIGLDAQGAYDRAYEKGILLGEDYYDQAIELFGKAAEVADDEEEHELAVRARANAALYAYITKGGLQHLRTLRGLLEQFPELERPGSKTDLMPTAPLLAEINARLVEVEADKVSDPSAAAEAHDRAAEGFKAIFNSDLQTYKWQAVDQHTDKASSRFFLHTGLAQWNRAVFKMASDPAVASEHMAKALGAFKNASDTAWAAKADEWLLRGRAGRTCWMCHREFQGAGVHFHSVSAQIAPYVVKRVKELGQDVRAIDYERDQVTLCTPCHSAVQRLADEAAAERVAVVREELLRALAERDAALKALDGRLRRVESVAHKH